MEWMAMGVLSGVVLACLAVAAVSVRALASANASKDAMMLRMVDRWVTPEMDQLERIRAENAAPDGPTKPEVDPRRSYKFPAHGEVADPAMQVTEEWSLGGGGMGAN